MRWYYIIVFQILLIQGTTCRNLEGTWSTWSGWSPCSQHCKSTRTRICQYPSQTTFSDGLEPCFGDSVQHNQCFRQRCMGATKLKALPIQPTTSLPFATQVLIQLKPSSNKRQHIIIIATVTVSVLLIALNVILYFCICNKRRQWSETDGDNHSTKPHSKKTLRERLSDSTRRFLDADPVRGWLFKASGDSNVPPAPASTSVKKDGFYNDQGKFIPYRSKTSDGGILPSIPTSENKSCQQKDSNMDTIYVNSKFLEHHMVAKKGYDRKVSEKTKRGPLPEIPTTTTTVSQKVESTNAYQTPIDYRTMELPSVPSNESPFLLAPPGTSIGHHQRNLGSSLYEKPVQTHQGYNYKTLPLPPLPSNHDNPYECIYEESVASQKGRQLPPIPTGNHARFGGARPRRQLPKTPELENPYLFSGNADEYLDLETPMIVLDKSSPPPQPPHGYTPTVAGGESVYHSLEQAAFAKQQYEKLKKYHRQQDPATQHSTRSSSRQPPDNQKKRRQNE